MINAGPHQRCRGRRLMSGLIRSHHRPPEGDAARRVPGADVRLWPADPDRLRHDAASRQPAAHAEDAGPQEFRQSKASRSTKGAAGGEMYIAPMVIGLCEGPIAGIGFVWRDKDSVRHVRRQLRRQRLGAQDSARRPGRVGVSLERTIPRRRSRISSRPMSRTRHAAAERLALAVLVGDSRASCRSRDSASARSPTRSRRTSSTIS
jgi:hypothetical protein